MGRRQGVGIFQFLFSVALIWAPSVLLARVECKSVGASLQDLSRTPDPSTTAIQNARQIAALESNGFLKLSEPAFRHPQSEQDFLSAVLSGRMAKIGATDPREYGLQLALEILYHRHKKGEPLDSAFFERIDRTLLSAKLDPKVAPSLSLADLETDFARTRKRGGQSFDRFALDDQKRIDRSDLVEPSAFQSLHEVARLNQLTLARMNTIVPTARPGRTAEASAEKIESIYQRTVQHPSAKICRIGQYDSLAESSAGNRFCYGRAFAGHVEALRQGISKDSIRKVFMVGRPDNGKTEWNYHVAVSIRGADGKWWVLDPDVGKVTVENWYDILSKKSGTGVSRLFFTDPRRFGPKVAIPYKDQSLAKDTRKLLQYHDTEYNNYFLDMMWEFSTSVRAEMGKPPLPRKEKWNASPKDQDWLWDSFPPEK